MPLELRIRSVTPQGEIEGYIALYGSPEQRDAYDTWFDRSQMPDLGLDYLPLPLMYEHGKDPEIGKQPIGKVVKAWFDDQGVRFKAFLDKGCRWFDRVVTEIREKGLATSSGSAEHLADFDEQGRFVNWLLTEVSLTEIPAEFRMPTVALLRSAHGQTLSKIPSEATGGPTAARGEAARSVSTRSIGDTRMTLADLGLDPNTNPADVLQALIGTVGLETVMQGVMAAEGAEETAESEAPEGAAPAATEAAAEMNSAPDAAAADPNAALLEQIKALLAGRSAKPAPKLAAKTIAGGIAVESVARSLLAALEKNKADAPAEEDRNVTVIRDRKGGAKITNVIDNKFDHLSAEDLAMGYQIVKGARNAEGRRKEGPVVSEEYLRALGIKAANLLEQDKSPIRSLRGKMPFTRANEVMQVSLSGYGDEWVIDLPGTTLWEKIRYETPLYNTMLAKGMEEKEIPQGFGGESIPLEGADPSWYVAGGASAMDATSGNPTPTFSTSKYGTGSTTIAIGKLSASVPYDREVDEDAVISTGVAAETMRKLRVTGTEQIEYILLNGDTATGANTNINLIDSTPATAPTKPSYMLLDGLLKLCLVTNSANSRDAGNALSDTDFLNTLALLPGTYRQDRSKLLFVIDTDTDLAVSNLSVVKTQDVFANATIENGTLRQVYRVDVLASGFMGLAYTAGKISATGSNNTRGRILAVRPDRWTFRWKRRLEVNTVYYPRQDVYEVIAHMRMGLGYFENTASAVSYNVSKTIA